MSLRRYSEMHRSVGTRWPGDVLAEIKRRDRGCVGPIVGMTGPCFGAPEADHVRASHGVGMKSPSTVENGVILCSAHHREKTEAGKLWRPKLLRYIQLRSAT
jgi:hypothetical protein